MKKRIISYLSFWILVTSFRIIVFYFCLFAYTFQYIVFNFWAALHCVTIPHFLYTFFDWGISRWFHILAIMNNAAMNIIEQMYVWYECASFGYMPKSGMNGLEVDWFPIFWEQAIVISKSGCTCLYSHQQLRSVSLSPHLLQQKLSPVFLIFTIWQAQYNISKLFLIAFPG